MTGSPCDFQTVGRRLNRNRGSGGLCCHSWLFSLPSGLSPVSRPPAVAVTVGSMGSHSAAQSSLWRTQCPAFPCLHGRWGGVRCSQHVAAVWRAHGVSVSGRSSCRGACLAQTAVSWQEICIGGRFRAGSMILGQPQNVTSLLFFLNPLIKSRVTGFY